MGLLFATVTDREYSERAIDNDLFDSRIGHEWLQNAEAEERVEQPLANGVGVHQQRRVGCDRSPLVRGDLFLDDRPHALLVLATGRKQSSVADRPANRFGNTVADDLFGGAVAWMERANRSIGDS